MRSRTVEQSLKHRATKRSQYDRSGRLDFIRLGSEVGKSEEEMFGKIYGPRGFSVSLRSPVVCHVHLTLSWRPMFSQSFQASTPARELEISFVSRSQEDHRDHRDQMQLHCIQPADLWVLVHTNGDYRLGRVSCRSPQSSSHALPVPDRPQ